MVCILILVLLTFVSLVYEAELKELQEIFQYICEVSRSRLTVAQASKASRRITTQERITRPMFKSWFEVGEVDRSSLEPIVNRLFDVIASSPQGISFLDYFEAITLLTKGEPERRAQCKIAILLIKMVLLKT